MGTGWVAADIMHVAVAAHDLYPDPGSGGTGRYVYETARRLVERGHRVSVVTRRRGDVPRRESLAGIDVYRYDVSIAGETAPSISRQLPAAARRVDDHATAISRDGEPALASFQGPLTSLLLDRALPDTIPRVTTFHSPWPTEYAIKTREVNGLARVRRRLNVAVRRGLERRVLSRSDGAITLSEYMRSQLDRVYDPAVDATVVPGGVDADRFAPDAGVHGPLDVDGPAFLTVRRLSERMGHERLLNAFATVADERPDARLFVAGDGPLRDRLERRARDLAIADRTTFLGYVPDADLPAAYATADAFVLPTRTLEGFGLATLEALASGTPVVATPVGGTVEIVSDLRERLPADPLVADASAPALAEGMAAWADLDARTRDRAGRECRRYASEEYDWEHTVSGLLSAYERYLDRVLVTGS